MHTINVSNVLNKLKNFSDKTDILIYEHNNDDEKIKNWISTIKQTVNLIVNGSCQEIPQNNKAISESSNETVNIPDLVKLVKDESVSDNKHRISTWLTEAQKDRVKHTGKLRNSLRKIVLGKKSDNRWEISNSSLSFSDSKGKLKPLRENTVSKSNICTTIDQGNTPKLVPNISEDQHSMKKRKLNEQNEFETCVVKPDLTDEENNHYTPVQSSVILAPNSCETPSIRSIKPKFDHTHVVKGKKQLSAIKKEIVFEENTPGISNQGSTSSDKYVTPDNKIENFHTLNEQKTILDSSKLNISKLSKNCMKRKSSVQLTRENLKKAKSLKEEIQEKKSARKICENNVRNCGRKGKTAKTSAVIQAKTSGILNQMPMIDNEKRILREIQKKEEIVSQNTQKIRSLRQQKIEENKKAREMKMEKAMQQRIKIEKEKEERLRCRTLSKQENLQQLAQTTIRAKLAPMKHEELNSTRKIDTPTSCKKKSASPKKISKNANGTTSTKKAPPKPVRTPAKKQKLNREDTEETEVSKTNQTHTLVDKEIFAKPTLNTTYVGSPNVKSGKVLTSTPTAKKLESKMKFAKTPVNDPTKKPTSYAVTPSESSFVSYDVSEIKSDDEDEYDEEEVNRKPIPSWATGVQLRNTLLNQHYNSSNIDTDELFGNCFETPDLQAIMGVQKRHYFKRTSSAIWLNSPNRSILAC